MNTNQPPANQQQAGPESTPISAGERLVAWMFAVGLVVFGLILIGDLILGFFR